MQKVVINTCYGGFSVSKEAVEFMAARGNKVAIEELSRTKQSVFDNTYYILDDEKDRDDPDLVAAVETLGDKANGFASDLKVVEIPDGVNWEIEEYDGMEHISEKHNTWW